MSLLLLPDEILSYIIKYLSLNEKINIRESCKGLHSQVNNMKLRVEKMNKKMANYRAHNEYIMWRDYMIFISDLGEII